MSNGNRFIILHSSFGNSSFIPVRLGSADLLLPCKEAGGPRGGAISATLSRWRTTRPVVPPPPSALVRYHGHRLQEYGNLRVLGVAGSRILPRCPFEKA